MSKGTTIGADVVQLRRDVRAQLQRRVLEAIEIVLEEELTTVLGTSRYERSPVRQGYRNGAERRRITTAMGTQSVRVPRARVVDEDGRSHEFRSDILPRCARRMREVDDAILGVYLAGGNSRRIRTALKPLLGSENLSKSAVSRIVSRLKEHFAVWRERDLTDEIYAILYLDGFHLTLPEQPLELDGVVLSSR